MPDRTPPLQMEILNKPLQKHGLLEEFNLPPKVIAFLRSNQRRLLAGLFCLVAAVLGWSYYQNYTGERNDRAAALLAGAMAENSLETRAALLENIVGEYGRTGAAGWAEIELGHLASANGNFREALRRYQAVLADISSKNPLLPLVQLSLAQTHENLGAPAAALIAYGKLAELPGFAGDACLAMARIHEGQGDLQQAREMYGKALAGEDLPPEAREMAEARLGLI